MKIDVLTLFPEMFSGFLQESMIAIAQREEKLEVNLINIRDFAFDKHRTADDYPYGGGAGMVMKPEPIHEALKSIDDYENTSLIYFTPQGKLLKQKILSDFSKKKHVILLCGHYKEIDQRIRDRFVTEEYSIGDYVLSGGEIPAMVFIDAVSRLQEGVLGDFNSAMTDSHQNGLLGCPHYTRPYEFLDMKVPDVLISGNHKKIDEWRSKKSLEITKKNRPDLLNEK
ncbi:MAG: tRNA (guanosine(37)-N1)-methyltransferase TrmD [Candidatus Cloacimonetes bacterium]|nr:tRNA (guanosine(37)-N1)-methyltransferase TrmD [Candidatus Cloacimonadota bacterium]